MRSISSAASLDLPTPGSPTTVASRHDRSPTTASNSRSRAASSRSRPTSGVRDGLAQDGRSFEVEQAVGNERVRLALRLDRRDRLDPRSVTHEAIGRLADQHVAGARGLLEPGRDVDGVAQHDRVVRREHPPATERRR